MNLRRSFNLSCAVIAGFGALYYLQDVGELKSLGRFVASAVMCALNVGFAVFEYPKPSTQKTWTPGETVK